MHIIDAVRLGTEDVSGLDYDSRMRSAELLIQAMQRDSLCSALPNQTLKNVMVIRTKHVFHLQDILSDVDQALQLKDYYKIDDAIAGRSYIYKPAGLIFLKVSSNNQLDDQTLRPLSFQELGARVYWTNTEESIKAEDFRELLKESSRDGLVCTETPSGEFAEPKKKKIKLEDQRELKNNDTATIILPNQLLAVDVNRASVSELKPPEIVKIASKSGTAQIHRTPDSLSKEEHVKDIPLVNPDLTLASYLLQTTINDGLSVAITREVKVQLGKLHPLLQHVLDVKIVCNERKNMVNIRIKKEFIKIVLDEKKGDVYYFCVLSEKFEAMLNIFVLHEVNGPLHELDESQVSDLEVFVKKLRSMKWREESSEPYIPICSEETYCFKDSTEKWHHAESVTAAVASMKLLRCEFNLKTPISSAFMRSKLQIMKEIITIDEYDKIHKVISEQACSAKEMRSRLQGIDRIYGALFEFTDGSTCPELRKNYINCLFVKEFDDLIFEFHLSDKIEPYVIAIVFDLRKTESMLLKTLTLKQLDMLKNSIDLFQKSVGITGELTYHYTTLKERDATDSFVANGGTSQQSKSHSSNFHLKIRVGTEVYKHKFPILKIDDLMGKLKQKAEPVHYNFSRKSESWEVVLCSLKLEV